jgi:hypothetical protein
MGGDGDSSADLTEVVLRRYETQRVCVLIGGRGVAAVTQLCTLVVHTSDQVGPGPGAGQTQAEASSASDQSTCAGQQP